MKNNIRIGIDLGGTKIEIIALDDTGDVKHRKRVPTPKSSYEETVKTIRELVFETEKEIKQQASVGIGTPGSSSRATGQQRNANSTCLNGHFVAKDISSALGREVRTANDANCFALSEAVDGAGRDGDIVFGVIIGTGTGGGVVINKRVLEGINGVGGEWGHNGLAWPDIDELPGPPCYCGKRGCIETFLSGTGLARDHREVTGQELLGAQIGEAAERGDAACQATMDRYHHRMARCLAGVVNLLDPDVIVLGGGVSNLNTIYTQVPALWDRWIFSDRVDTRLVRAQHGDSSGVRGAAWLWPLEDTP